MDTGGDERVSHWLTGEAGANLASKCEIYRAGGSEYYADAEGCSGVNIYELAHSAVVQGGPRSEQL